MRRKNTQMTTNILIVSLLLIGVVYALLQTNLQIDGIAKILHNTWDVHFDNIQISEDSVPIGENDSQATIDPENNCKIDFEVTLNIPGDFYEFTVDVVNEGTIDGMIGTLNKTLTINNETVQEVPDYLNYTITYDDGVEIEEHHKVSAGTVETYKVRLEFKTDIEELPQAATIVTSLEPQYVQADSSAIEVNHPNRLYNVFKEEYNSGSGLVREYTGEHKDSFTKNGIQKIYHWYGSNNTNGTVITNKNNVIFANHCWQMVRTTDTGGVKLIYNGEAVDGKCLSTRGTHVGYASHTSQSLNSNYWYGTDYTYDSTNNVFSISGTTEQTTWNASTGPGLIGKYTCKSATEAGTCATLYLVESYYNTTSAYVISLNSNSNYSQFGTLKFNANYNSPTYVGYMYGDVYLYSSMYSTFSQSFTKSVTRFSTINFTSNYKYSKIINDTGSGYELVNPILGSDIPEDTYAGYYTFRSDTTVSGTSPYYIVGLNSNSNYHYAFFTYPNNINIYNLMIGDSITDKLDGTYELSGTTTSVTPAEWYTNYASYVGKYTCGDSSTTICASPRYITSTTISDYNYLFANEKIMIGKTRSGTTLTDTVLVRKDELIKNRNNYSNYKYTCKIENATCIEHTLRLITSLSSTGYNYAPNHYYGSGVTWDGTAYTLIDPIEIENYNNLNSISTHHYVCVDFGKKTCTTVAYIYHYSGSGIIYYITLKDGVLTVSKALEDMFTKNTTNSTIKSGIDAWYKKYLYNDFDQYIEDTIYCNDRSIKTIGGWDDNGGMTNAYLRFKEYTVTSGLNCTNTTDQFSLSNSSAPLTYKVGLMSSPEMNLLNNQYARKSGQYYWLISPLCFDLNYAEGNYMNTVGITDNHNVSNTDGVRPTISLRTGITYSKGDGSMEHPYVIKTD